MKFPCESISEIAQGPLDHRYEQKDQSREMKKEEDRLTHQDTWPCSQSDHFGGQA